MKILVLADVESKALWDYFDKSKLEGIDLIISCGDLKPAYLSFIVTFTHAPVLYVHGNHDGVYEEKPPEGCECIDGRIYVYNGIRILGLGGSMQYNMGKHQYTERQMKKRFKKVKRKIRWKKGIDILVTHAPARGVNDEDNPAHKGFEIFNKIIEKYKPRFFVHGHVHLSYNYEAPRLCRVDETTVVNAYERYVIDYDLDSIVDN